ncbi:MAG: hypothetical protein WAS05_01375 [Candidatus Nanopelagicales bacterium]
MTDEAGGAQEIRANSVLPANREVVELTTADGLKLVGELAMPVGGPPVATVVCVHPLPTAGGMMDSHLLRKMSWRLPALAQTAVLRFNTRGTCSPHSGTSEGEFDMGVGEGLDVQAAIDYVVARGLPTPWLVGWSFGTDVIIKHPELDPVAGIVLLSPPLRFSHLADLEAWDLRPVPKLALIPEHDDYLIPVEAVNRFSVAPSFGVVPVEDGKHLWVGEKFVSRALGEIASCVNPASIDPVAGQLPATWDGPMDKHSDL